MVFLKISQNSREKAWDIVSVLKRLCNFIKVETLRQSTYFYRTPLVAACKLWDFNSWTLLPMKLSINIKIFVVKFIISQDNYRVILLTI